MGITKTELFTARQNELATLFRVLGHPARIAILDHLIQAQACINSDLVDELGLAQPTVSQHLRELKKIGIIKGSIEGTSVCYCIDPETFRDIQNELQNFLSQMQKCCDPNNC